MYYFGHRKYKQTYTLIMTIIAKFSSWLCPSFHLQVTTTGNHQWFCCTKLPYTCLQLRKSHHRLSYTYSMKNITNYIMPFWLSLTISLINLWFINCNLKNDLISRCNNIKINNVCLKLKYARSRITMLPYSAFSHKDVSKMIIYSQTPVLFYISFSLSLRITDIFSQTHVCCWWMIKIKIPVFLFISMCAGNDPKYWTFCYYILFY